MRSLFCLLFIGFTLQGCVHTRSRPTQGCAYVAYPLSVDGLGPPKATDFESIMATAMSAPVKSDRGFDRPSVLILSGGSQHGAFGAGFFAGLPSVPRYKMVTAVSTGALQSTFLFLANDPVPSDRVYAPYMTGAPKPHTNAGDLALAYSVGLESDLLRVGSFGQFGGVVRGSIAQFAPLRNVLEGLLSRETLLQVGRDYNPDPREGRRLFVGVTDVNDGNGYAIDMTELTNRLVRGTQSFDQVQNCYIDALIASSSVPLAVPPVSLEARVSPTETATSEHMYIDGGARFGVFWKQLGFVLQNGVEPDISLIVNGKLFGSPWLDKKGQPQSKWSSIGLGLRAVDILENQVYRFSIENIERLGEENARVRMAFISNLGLSDQWSNPDDFVFDGLSCAAWSDEDKKAKVTEFHPRYMRCLVEYGRKRGEAQAWNVGKK